MALPHWPFQPTPNSKGWNPSHPQETDLRYAADMIEYTDTAVGKLMRGLKQRGLTDDTIVIFYSDNGTHLDVSSQMNDGRIIRGGKAMTTQTGIHVPLIVHCPRRFQPSIVDGIVDASDFFVTLLDLAGIDRNTSHAKLDGVSFLPQLLGQPRRTVRPRFFGTIHDRDGTRNVLLGMSLLLIGPISSFATADFFDCRMCRWRKSLSTLAIGLLQIARLPTSCGG